MWHLRLCLHSISGDNHDHDNRTNHDDSGHSIRRTPMSLIILLVVLVLLFGGGGYAYRGHVGAGSGLGLVLVIVLVLFLMGYL